MFSCDDKLVSCVQGVGHPQGRVDVRVPGVHVGEGGRASGGVGAEADTVGGRVIMVSTRILTGFNK